MLPALAPAERRGLLRRTRIETPEERAVWQSAFVAARGMHGVVYASDFAWRSIRAHRGDIRALTVRERQLALPIDGGA